MIAGLDTSVIVRLLVGEPVGQARIATRRVQELHDTGATILVTDLALTETFHALHHHYGVPNTQARAMLLRFVESGLVTLEPDGVAAALLPAGGAGTVDRSPARRERRAG